MTCHGSVIDSPALAAARRIALVGHPNVGKSVFFQHLTGQRVTVSNYPGTTVETSRGLVRHLADWELVDTPGVITLPAHSEDEVVTERVLLEEDLSAVLQVGDAKNPRRTLMLTVQLAEMGLPLALALNMNDEAQVRGIQVDAESLSQKLGIPVLLTTAVQQQGMAEVTAALTRAMPARLQLTYPTPIEAAVADMAPHLPAGRISARSLALLWLSGDRVAEAWLQDHVSADDYHELAARRQELEKLLQADPAILIRQTRQRRVNDLLAETLRHVSTDAAAARRTFLSRLTTHPVWGTVILAGVLYALYWFVGVFGAGVLVDALESRLFGEIINPWISHWVVRLTPTPWLADLFVGEYGLWSMGITYAFALIFPIVTTFFLAFGVLEDSGYLPRLAALSNRFFTALGLNGKAVLPMILGLGCVTMATLTTRVLESKRDRLLTVLLLALAIPCSAQLGVVMGMLAGISLGATLIWGAMVGIVLFTVGWLAARLMPGERAPLLVELPPLRWPQLSNVLLKTVARLEWYLKEVAPIFLLGTFLMFVLDRIHVLQVIIRAGEPLVTGWLGLPPETSAAFLMGFLRRDFGATGLFVMNSQGMLTPEQVVVAMVTITLFVPCIASVLVMAKEYTWRVALGITAFVFPLALLVGGLLNHLLLWIGWGLS
jgi:ferrous iron transport protein B